ncbi:5'-nucleotidase [Saccharothrix longispora]|uniref:5'-nucleotidase n=1 Tax=Saccharothrix longispora TaxID=33920 RepID=A0ABU1PX26_9PSEU|nr:5'-nucleotidase [Saccharothrix longispora]MDR6595202.1 5'-nucleotidase [Saccharothrix longispora]
MAYDLNNRLVVGIASSALFDLKKSDKVFREQGVAMYRDYQERRADKPLKPGVAFPFVKRLLALNDLATKEDPLVEVIVLSKNSPDTGLRVMRSIQHHDLPITRAIFQQGRAPHEFMKALNMSLFLSGNEEDVYSATAAGLPAGRALKSTFVDDGDSELRIAFDFDSVLADDESERVMKTGDLHSFHEHERLNVATAHTPGPLQAFSQAINRIRAREEQERATNREYRIRLRVSIVTARNAPSHERAIRSIKEWGLLVNDAFFLGGIEKRKVLAVLRPHIFFDDQRDHLESASMVPCVHVPFGIANEATASAKTPG